MKLIIAGSRGITDYKIVRSSVISSGIWATYGKTIEIVCGLAKGVDELGRQFGVDNNLVIHEFPANWELGKSAGHIRNRQMGDFADQLLAVWDGESRGTKGMIDYMKSLNKPCHIILVKPLDNKSNK